VQFNGFFGYRWCENRGTRVDNKTVYNYEEISVLRDKKSVEECARRANESQYPVKGLKVYSIFSLFLTLFDIILGIVFDSMHCVDLGVMKQLATLWFNPKNCDQPWYMGLSLKDIVKCLIYFPLQMYPGYLPVYVYVQIEVLRIEEFTSVLLTLYFQRNPPITVF
jgi:hypothetical protein